MTDGELVAFCALQGLERAVVADRPRLEAPPNSTATHHRRVRLKLVGYVLCKTR